MRVAVEFFEGVVAGEVTSRFPRRNTKTSVIERIATRATMSDVRREEDGVFIGAVSWDFSNAESCVKTTIAVSGAFRGRCLRRMLIF